MRELAVPRCGHVHAGRKGGDEVSEAETEGRILLYGDVSQVSHSKGRVQFGGRTHESAVVSGRVTNHAELRETEARNRANIPNALVAGPSGTWSVL